MYQKVGKFGNSGKFSTDTQIYGDQIKGFGFMHDGGMDTLDKFLQGSVLPTTPGLKSPTWATIFPRNGSHFFNGTYSPKGTRCILS